MNTAKITIMGAMVLNCLLRYALAPVWTALLTSSILSLPLACFKAYRARPKATKMAATAVLKIIVKKEFVANIARVLGIF